MGTAILTEYSNSILQSPYAAKLQPFGRSLEAAKLPGQRRDALTATAWLPGRPCEHRRGDGFGVHPRGTGTDEAVGNVVVRTPAHDRGIPVAG